MLPVAILAGGLATRLRPITETVPKALIEIRGEPFLAHQLRLLSRAGIGRAVLCVGYLGDRIRDYAGDGAAFGLRVEYSLDGPRLLGTGGAIRRALPLLGEAFFTVYGDSYLACDYHAVERAFYAAGQPGLMTVYRNEGQWDTSNVEFSQDRIAAYDKRNRTPRMRHIDYGLGVFRRAAFDRVPEDCPHDLAAVYQDLLARGELAACEIAERFYEIGSPEGIRELEAFLPPMTRAVFLDRDGVLNEALVCQGRPYTPATVEELKIYPDAAGALGRLKAAGWLLIVVTNQPDVARGTRSRQSVDALNTAVRAALPVDDVFVCWHDDADGCLCRKPKPGLLVDAAARYGIDLGLSFLVGDRWRDIDAGAAAGCRTVLIDRGYQERAPRHPPDFRAGSLTDAADWILRHAPAAG